MKREFLFVACSFFTLTAPLAAADDPIKLPAFEIHAKWQQWFPADKPFFAEKYPEGNLQGMHLRYQSRLEGPSAMLHESGKLKSLAYYPGGTRQGSYRLWDEDGKMLFFGQFKDGKPHGVLCLFGEDDPCFVQHYDAGTLANETLVTRNGKSIVPVADAAKLDKARERMTTTLKQIDKEESDLRTRLREYVAKQSKTLDDAQMKAIRQAGATKLQADVQRARQEADVRTAAANTFRNGNKNRKGRTAAADARLAAQDRKATARQGGEITAEDKRKAGNVAEEQEGESKNLYDFAIAGLETAMPAESPSLRLAGSSATRTYLVSYQEAGKNGDSHIDEIVATSPDDAKAKLRAYRPKAKIQKVTEK